MKLKRTIVSAHILLAFGGLATPQDKPRLKPSFSLALNATRKEVKIGSPISLDLIMTNTSGQDLYFSVRRLEAKGLNYVPVTVRQMDVQLYDSEGLPVPLTLYGKTVRGKCGECGGSGTLGGLRPGESLHEEADLSKEFELTKPGKYTVHAERVDDQNKVLVKSDKITLTLTQ
jgi:hypothetical protein